LGTENYVALLLMALFGVACGSSSTPAAATSPAAAPTSDAVTQTYVALIKSYWVGHMAADGASGGVNLAARACLGTINDTAPADANLVEPGTCHDRGVLILASQEKFLADLKGTIAPERFGEDDKIFRRDLPSTIVLLKAMNSAAGQGNKQGTFDAANSYAHIMLTWVVGALDDVDPSTRHY
jgi:hypothetical protein